MKANFINVTDRERKRRFESAATRLIGTKWLAGWIWRAHDAGGWFICILAGQNEMVLPSFKVGVFLSMLSLAIGCARPTRQLSRLNATQAAESTAQVQNETVPLSAGDTVLVSVEMDPVIAGPETQQIGADGIIAMGGQQIGIAGLTPDEAASKIRLSLIPNYYGIKLRRVTVIKVQSTR